MIWPFLALVLLLAACRPTSGGAELPTSRTQLGENAAERPTVVKDLGTRPFGDDWAAFLGPTGDGKSREKGIRTKWGVTGPPLVWHRAIGTSYGMPAISKGRLYMFHRFGDMARVTCMASETGEELWNYEYPTDYVDYYNYDNGPRCAPVVDEDRVYLYGAEGMLTCLAAVDGRELWKVDTAADFGVVQNFFGVGSCPVVEGDLLLVHVGGSPRGSPPIHSGLVKPDGSCVVAFDKRSGKVRYKCGDDLAGYASPVVATLHGRRWCFMFAREGLLAFNPATGLVDFHYPWRARILESVNASNPVVVADQVLISEAYSSGHGASLLRVLPSGGYEVVWKDDPRSREKAMQCHFMTPIHVDGYLYGSSGRHSPDAVLKCIRWSTGETRWSVPGLGWTSLLFVDGHFIALSEDGTLRLIRANPDFYELIAEVTPQDLQAAGGGDARLIRPRAWAAPILSHGLLYVRGRDRLVCFELIPTAGDGTGR